MNTISADEFLNLFTNLQTATLEDYVIKGDVRDMSPRSFDQIPIVKNCTFEGNFNVSNYSVTNFFFIDTCHFQKDVRFYGSEFKTGIYFNHGCSINGKLHFEKITTGSIEIDTCEIDKGIVLSHCKAQRFQFEKSNSSLGSLHIKESEISVSVKIGTVNLSGLKISNSTLASGLTIDNLFIKSENLEFTNNIFQKYIWITGGMVKGDFNIYQNQFDDIVVIDDLSVQSNLSIIGSVFKSSISYRISDKQNNLGVSPPESVLIGAASFGNGCVIENNHTKNIIRTINTIKIKCSKKLEGEVTFSNFCVQKLIINGANHGCRLAFDKIQLNNVNIEKFSNFSNLQLLNIKAFDKNSAFNINNSFLGKTQFFNVDLASFQKILILDSQLSEIIASNVKWPEEILVSTEEDVESKVQLFERQRENYRQLKVAMNNQGNKYEALAFEEREARAYKSWLFNVNGRWGDKFILWTNQSNDHGRSWLRPVGLMLTITFVLYIIFIFSASPDIGFSNSYQSGDALRFLKIIFYEKLGVFLQLLNPAHLLKNLDDELKYTNWSIFWDIWIRIFVGYFIFQTVRAFRKYSR